MLTPRSCSQRTFVEPCRNHSSSTTTDRTCTFLVVTSGKPVGQVEPHLVAEDAAGAGAGAIGLHGAGGQDAIHQIQVLLHGSSLGAGRPVVRSGCPGAPSGTPLSACWRLASDADTGAVSNDDGADGTTGPADWIDTPITADLLRGALELERTDQGVVPHRLPGWARAQCTDGQLAMVEAQPSGVRLVFRSSATAVELDTLRTTVAYVGAPPRPDGVYDLLIDGELAGQASVTGGNVLLVDMSTGSMETRPGPIGTVRFDGLDARSKDIEIWLPWNEITALVALRTDAPVEIAPDRVARVWLHHGSSISHGSNAASPTTTWPALAASLGGVDLINLGFGGSALLDPFTARVMRDTPADLISVKIGINLVNTDADAAARVHLRRARLPGHHPRGPPEHPAARRLADPVPHSRGHPRPQRAGLQRRAAESSSSWPAATPRNAAGKLTLTVIRRTRPHRGATGRGRSAPACLDAGGCTASGLRRTAAPDRRSGATTHSAHRRRPGSPRTGLRAEQSRRNTAAACVHVRDMTRP